MWSGHTVTVGGLATPPAPTAEYAATTTRHATTTAEHAAKLSRSDRKPITGTAIAPPMTEWEYKIVELADGGLLSSGGEPTEADLNELGAQGWELAASLTGSERSLGGRPKSKTDALVFKRPKE